MLDVDDRFAGLDTATVCEHREVAVQLVCRGGREAGVAPAQSRRPGEPPATVYDQSSEATETGPPPGAGRSAPA